MEKAMWKKLFGQKLLVQKVSETYIIYLEISYFVYAVNKVMNLIVYINKYILFWEWDILVSSYKSM